MVLKVTIEEVLAKDEKQIFDRKSIQIRSADLSETICAFANADGGTIAIGISDKKRRIEGVDRMCRSWRRLAFPIRSLIMTILYLRRR